MSNKSLKRNKWRSSGGDVDPSGDRCAGASMMNVRGDIVFLLGPTVPPMSKLGRLRRLFDFWNKRRVINIMDYCIHR